MKKITWLVLPALYLLTGCHQMVGDSITWASKDVFEARIPNSQADGVAGRSPDTTLNPGEWLIVQDDGEHMDYLTQAMWMAWVGYHLPDDRCLMWVTPWDQIKTDVTVEVANAIREYADDVQPTCWAVADWAAVVSLEPELLGDGIHPTEDGVSRLVDIIKGAMNV